MQFYSLSKNTKVKLTDAKKHCLDFGKYNGKTLGELSKSWSGRQYLKYLLCTNYDQTLCQNVQLVLKRTKYIECSLDEAGKFILPFGNLKGQTLKEICSLPKGYSYLLWTMDWDKCPADLKQAIKVIKVEFDRQVTDLDVC